MDTGVLDTPALTRELNVIAAENGRPPLRYRIVADLIRDGSIEAERVRGRYYVARAAIPDIAAALGLEPPREPQHGRRQRAA